MSHDPEAVKALATALWDTEVPTWGDAVDMARALAAAGYTVTRERYEQLKWEGATAWYDPPDGHGGTPDLFWMPTTHDPEGAVPLYRRVEDR